MQCGNCGEPIEQGAAFCGNCGAPIVAQAAPPITQPPVPQPAAQAPQPVPGDGAIPPSPSMPQQPPGGPAMPPAPVASNPVMPSQSQMPYSPPPQVPGTAPYGMPAHQPGNTKAIVALIVGILGVPGAIVPIVGLALGITGVVLGNMSRSAAKRPLNLVAIVVSSIAIGLSLILWAIFAVQIYQEESRRNALSSAMTASDALATPYYEAALGYITE